MKGRQKKETENVPRKKVQLGTYQKEQQRAPRKAVKEHKPGQETENVMKMDGYRCHLRRWDLTDQRS